MSNDCFLFDTDELSNPDLCCPIQWGSWRLIDGRWLTHAPKGSLGYDVDLWAWKNHRDVAHWLFHIGGKVDWYEPGNFYKAVCCIFSGSDHRESFDGKQEVERYLAWRRELEAKR